MTGLDTAATDFPPRPGYNEQVATNIEWEPLPDMSEETFQTLRTRSEGGDTGLDRAIQRLTKSLNDPNGVISAFSSFVE